MLGTFHCIKTRNVFYFDRVGKVVWQKIEFTKKFIKKIYQTVVDGYRAMGDTRLLY